MRRDSFAARLHGREISDPGVRSKSYRKLYSDRQLIDRLDIVNELDGHSGCVNALCWSRSGNLLASGSDDQHLNIHTYQPDNATSQFQLTSTVATGHTQNIFSVKFMPHSNDNTLITCAGDSQVRIFDLEYAGQAGAASAAATMASAGRRRRRNHIYEGVRYLTDGDTNARVYRSHGDRVKRIVTESSPHLFLTCSEDGEVRQWDLRQPSSTYPEPRGSRYTSDTSVPPPLISYKRYGLDLNTISCSASQPHYILMGGAHLHAFLHDRRFTGRDRLVEMGRPISSTAALSTDEQDLLGQATQCVRKFAPKGQQKMRRADNGHITACKISDARPDEAIVSWSGDQIYSFSLTGESDADCTKASATSARKSKVKESRDRKRKRQANGSEISAGQEARVSSRPHRVDVLGQEAALRIHYQNGQSEDISLTSQRQPLTEQQRAAQRTARAARKIRSALFKAADEGVEPSAQFTLALGQAVSILADMDEVMREWGYPMPPDAEDVIVQNNFRKARESTRRFVQAGGTLARVLGGKLQTPSGSSALMSSFMSVDIRATDLALTQQEQFSYDFLKAILLWLDSGIGRLIEGFSRPSDMAATAKIARRLPIPAEDQSQESLDEYLIPYLLTIASNERPIFDVEANRFQTDQSRQIRTEKEAVLSFASAIKMPFADLSSAVTLVDDTGNETYQAQDRQTALRYWAGKIGRGLLLNVDVGLDDNTVGCSFGGVARSSTATEDGFTGLMAAEESEQSFAAVEMLNGEDILNGANAEDISMAASEARNESRGAHVTVRGSAGLPGAFPDDEADADDSDGDDGDCQAGEDDNEDDDLPSDSSSEADEEDGVPNLGVPRYVYRPAVQRRRLRPKVEADIQCGRSTRTYRGHCNVRTVKDVNFFGPDDEYVVSGSDDGNLFIWDRKSAELINILEGDGEVVNVIQGHPYETMLAVSGIDHTIKIFSPDARTREIARLGQGISAHDASEFSSVAWPMRVGRRRPRPRESDRTNGESTSEPAVPSSAAGEQADADEDNEDYIAPNGLSSRKRMHNHYSITQQNNMDREGGREESIIQLPHAQLLQLLFGQLGNVGFMPTFE